MKNSKGFTLIELLVVVAILGILSAIAIPQYASYRAQTFCSRLTSDAKHAFTAMEAYYAKNLLYGTLAQAKFSSSKDVTTIIVSTSPLIILSSDDTTTCPLGTYTLSAAAGVGVWG
jgi:type IV pilus assembly protein PilA